MDIERLKEIARFITELQKEKAIIGINSDSIHMREEDFHELFNEYDENRDYSADFMSNFVMVGNIACRCLIKKPSKENPPWPPVVIPL